MMAKNNAATWYQALKAAAQERGLELSLQASNSMGTIVLQARESDRAVSIKRRLVHAEIESERAIVWAVWQLNSDVRPISICYESLVPQPQRVHLLLDVLQRWLIDRVSEEEIKAILDSSDCDTRIAVRSLEPAPKDIQIGNENELNVAFESSSWRLVSHERLLTRGRALNGTTFTALPVASLDKAAKWLRDNWQAIAYSTDTRPRVALEGSASACRAFERARLHARQEPGVLPDLESWWSRHAFRAADASLPNLFVERQDDEIIFSWDSSPSETCSFWIGAGIVAIPVSVALPRLRQLCAYRGAEIVAPADQSARADIGYGILGAYNPRESVSPDWLAHRGFSARDSAEFAVSGSSRHPIVGLLRSSRATELNLTDIEAIYTRLRSASLDSYKQLRSLADGLDSQIDPREPWESGYQLARRVRHRLGIREVILQPEIDLVVRNLSVDSFELPLTDASIRGACVGSPRYHPAIFINGNCVDARGMSGRRITLAHELCHLLFDRSSMRGLARFEGGVADSDRLFEMRANAFAVEFLVPMENLTDLSGDVLQGDDLRRLAEIRGVSVHALKAHAENLRRRLA